MITLKSGSVGVVFTDTLLADGSPIPLDDCTVFFVLCEAGSSESAVRSAATIEDPDEGTVTYTTAEGDLDVAGLYRQEWQIEFVSGDRFPVPSETYNVVQVLPDLPEGIGS